MSTTATTSTDVALIDDDTAASLESMDRPSQEIFISESLDKARNWLEVAKHQADAPKAIADFKAEVIAVAQYAKQKKLSTEIQMDATLMVRRAERELGVAIREGQKAGSIANNEDLKRKAVAVRDVNLGRIDQRDVIELINKPAPRDYVHAGELSGNGAGIYHLTDGVSDDQFSSALDQAKEERNPSRANLVRKIREVKGEAAAEPGGPGSNLPDEIREQVQDLAGQGTPSRAIAAELDIDKSTVNRILNGRPKQGAVHDTATKMEGLTNSLWGLRHALQSITAIDADLDPDQVAAWDKEIRSTVTELNRIKKLLKGTS